MIVIKNFKLLESYKRMYWMKSSIEFARPFNKVQEIKPREISHAMQISSTLS